VTPAPSERRDSRAARLSRRVYVRNGASMDLCSIPCDETYYDGGAVIKRKLRTDHSEPPRQSFFLIPSPVRGGRVRVGDIFAARLPVAPRIPLPRASRRQGIGVSFVQTDGALRNRRHRHGWHFILPIAARGWRTTIGGFVPSNLEFRNTSRASAGLKAAPTRARA